MATLPDRPGRVKPAPTGPCERRRRLAQAVEKLRAQEPRWIRDARTLHLPARVPPWTETGWPGALHVHLSVTEPAKDARRLYPAAGFREWGVEPRPLQWEGRFVAEHHLVLDL